MSARATVPIAAPTSVTQGAATEVLQFRQDAQAVLTGTFTGTYQLQYLIAGTTWINTGSPLTAAGAVDIPNAALAVRWDCTAYTSGTPLSWAGGIVAY